MQGGGAGTPGSPAGFASNFLVYGMGIVFTSLPPPSSPAYLLLSGGPTLLRRYQEVKQQLTDLAPQSPHQRLRAGFQSLCRRHQEARLLPLPGRHRWHDSNLQHWWRPGLLPLGGVELPEVQAPGREEAGRDCDGQVITSVMLIPILMDVVQWICA